MSAPAHTIGDLAVKARVVQERCNPQDDINADFVLQLVRDVIQLADR
jgi:hypothetical protein